VAGLAYFLTSLFVINILLELRALLVRPPPPPAASQTLATSAKAQKLFGLDAGARMSGLATPSNIP